MQSPSIGRIVRYVLAREHNAGQVRAAIITNVIEEDRISLTCFPDAGNDRLGVTYSATDVPLDDIDHKPGTWHWPQQN